MAGEIDLAMVGLKTVGDVAGSGILNKTDLQKETKLSCGKKPILNIGGKKDRYFECAQNVATKSERAAAAAIELEAKKKETAAAMNAGAPAPKNNTAMYIGIGVGALVLITVVGVVIYKMGKK